MSTTSNIQDAAADQAIRLAEAYHECDLVMRQGVLGDRLRAQYRQRAIVRAARSNEKVWRLFQCRIDGFLGGPITEYR